MIATIFETVMLTRFGHHFDPKCFNYSFLKTNKIKQIHLITLIL